MDDPTKRKLSVVIAKDADRRRALADAMSKEDAAQRERDQQKQAARERWPAAQNDIKLAVDEINAQLAQSDMSLEITDGKHTSTALAQLLISLRSKDQTTAQQYIAVNVSASGIVEPVFLIPHSGRYDKKLQLAHAQQDDWSAMIVEFMDQAISHSATRV